MPFKDYETLKVYQLLTTRVRFNILFSLFGKCYHSSAKIWSTFEVKSIRHASLHRILMILRIFFRFGLINRAE